MLVSKNILVLLIAVLLGSPFSIAMANGDSGVTEVVVRKAVKKTNRKPTKNEQECRTPIKTPIKKHKRSHKQNHVKKYSNRCMKCSKKYRVIKVTTKPRVIETCDDCENDIILERCHRFPPRRVRCEIINPADLVDSTCSAFTEKLKTCEAYSCQAPYTLDPTVKTKWQILGKNGDRCIVSNTTDDIGIKDNNGNVLPITQICEYDKIGVSALIERFVDQEGRYYHFSTCDRFEGIHNCSVNSRGQTIQEAMDNPAGEIDLPASGSGG